MTVRRRSLAVLALAALVIAWAFADALSGHSELLYLVPAFVLVAPLALGRYVGEESIAALAAARRSVPRARAASSPAPRSRRRTMRRGGRLVGSSLAKRPPPRAATALT